MRKLFDIVFGITASIIISTIMFALMFKVLFSDIPGSNTGGLIALVVMIGSTVLSMILTILCLNKAYTQKWSVNDVAWTEFRWFLSVIGCIIAGVLLGCAVAIWYFSGFKGSNTDLRKIINEVAIVHSMTNDLVLIESVTDTGKVWAVQRVLSDGKKVSFYNLALKTGGGVVKGTYCPTNAVDIPQKGEMFCIREGLNPLTKANVAVRP